MPYISYPDGTPAINIEYSTIKEAENAAARMLSDPRRKADKIPHIPRKTWRVAGYVINPSSCPWPENPEDWRIKAIQNPGNHKCPTDGKSLCYTGKKQRTLQTYDDICKIEIRKRLDAYWKSKP